MICVSVTPTSRKLAKADLLNASRQGDLIELCLDNLVKVPDMGDMIADIEKPILVSCRRPQDGGKWKGTEEERLQLLRNAIVAGPAYIELELDIADKIPRFGEVKRVISYNSIDEPLGKIDDIFDEAWKAKADVVKFTWPTRTLEEAWPLLAAVSQKRELPVVGMGLGRAGLTFSLLGRKYGSPWIYAALEKGMEAHDGQPTVWELRESYGWQEVTSKTRFVGVVGLGETETTSVRVLNAAFRQFDANVRCLPLRLGNLKNLDRMLSTLKIRSLIVSPQEVSSVLPLVEHPGRTVAESQYADMLLHRDDGWHGHNTIRKALVAAIEGGTERGLEKRNVLLLGCGPLSRAVAYGLQDKNVALSISAPDDKQAQAAAEALDSRFIPYSAMYDAMVDFVILTDPSIEIGHRQNQLNPSLLREHMAVLDISRFPDSSGLTEEARQRGSTVIEPSEVYVNQLTHQFRAITGKDLPTEAFRDGLAGE